MSNKFRKSIDRRAFLYYLCEQIRKDFKRQDTIYLRYSISNSKRCKSSTLTKTKFPLFRKSHLQISSTSCCKEVRGRTRRHTIYCTIGSTSS